MKRKKNEISLYSLPPLLALHSDEPILARILYCTLYTIDDTVIVHHGETCSVRLFVLFRETVFSPVPPPPFHNHHHSIDHGAWCEDRAEKKNEISIKENDKSVYYLDVMRDNSIIFLLVRIRRNPRRHSYCTS
uniref:Uncharacterized protein n=1 Tax=Schizaphis graminum TaxID=13262 RepID=A0A2S2P3A2_SCHGA